MSTDPISTQIIPLRILQGEELTPEKKGSAIDYAKAITRMNNIFKSEEEFIKSLQGMVFRHDSALKTPCYYEFNPQQSFK